MSLSIDAVVLTRGERPRELERCVDSIKGQDVPIRAVLVENGTAGSAGSDRFDVVVTIPDNVGIPAGRNRGLAECHGDLVLFLDDDAWVPGRETAGRAASVFEDHDDIGVVGLRIVDPESGQSQRRWLPRLDKSDISSGPVSTFPGGASLIRRRMLHEIGPFPDHFFYSGEETDTAWRAIDHGWQVWFAGDLLVHHPATRMNRHQDFCRYTMRNRVMIARRNLPPFHAIGYVAAGMVRALAWGCLLDAFKGLWDGISMAERYRSPISRETRRSLWTLGRPPIL